MWKKCRVAVLPVLIQGLCLTKANSIFLRMSLWGNPYSERTQRPDQNLITVRWWQSASVGPAEGSERIEEWVRSLCNVCSHEKQWSVAGLTREQQAGAGRWSRCDFPWLLSAIVSSPDSKVKEAIAPSPTHSQTMADLFLLNVSKLSDTWNT